MMCNQVRIDGSLCSTPRQLAARLGGKARLQWLDREGDMDWCLCIVDLPATLDRAGLRWRRDVDHTTFVVER